MKKVVIVLLLLSGCAPGTIIWTVPGHSSAPRQAEALGGRSVPPSEELTERDRVELNRLLAKIGGN